LGFICRLELLEPDACLELEEAIDELEGLGVLGFQFERKKKLISQRVYSQIEKCRKSE